MSELTALLERVKELADQSEDVKLKTQFCELSNMVYRQEVENLELKEKIRLIHESLKIPLTFDAEKGLYRDGNGDFFCPHCRDVNLIAVHLQYSENDLFGIVCPECHVPFTGSGVSLPNQK
jgi:hypothetical protein